MGDLRMLLEMEGMDEAEMLERGEEDGCYTGICTAPACSFLKYDMEMDGQGDCEECGASDTVIAGPRLAGLV